MAADAHRGREADGCAGEGGGSSHHAARPHAVAKHVSVPASATAKRQGSVRVASPCRMASRMPVTADRSRKGLEPRRPRPVQGRKRPSRAISDWAMPKCPSEQGRSEGTDSGPPASPALRGAQVGDLVRQAADLRREPLL